MSDEDFKKHKKTIAQLLGQAIASWSNSEMWAWNLR